MSKKISQLTTATDVTVNDFFQVVDLEDPTMATSGTNKKISARTLGNLLPVTAAGSSASRTLKDRFADTVNVKDFGAVGDGVTDDTAAIQAALNFAAGANTPSIVKLPSGIYRLTTGLIIPDDGIALEGEGFGRSLSTTVNPSTRLLADFVGGWVITCQQACFVLKDLEIYGSTNIRWAASGNVTGSTGGVYLRDAVNTTIERVLIYQESGIGFYISKECPSTKLTSVTVEYCKGHAFYVDDGALDSSSGYAPSGIITFDTCRAARVDCCALFAGDPNNESATGLSAYRLYLLNNEFFFCGGNTALSPYANYVIQLRKTDNCTIIGTAVASPSGQAGGNSLTQGVLSSNNAVAALVAGIYVDGKNNYFINNRYIRPYRPAVFISSTSSNITIDGAECRHTSGIDFNPVVDITEGCSGINISNIGSLQVTSPTNFTLQKVVTSTQPVTSTTTEGLYLFVNGKGLYLDPVVETFSYFNGTTQRHRFGADGTYRSSAEVRPATNNTASLGIAGARWSEVFAVNGTINTSDANSKQQIQDIPEAVFKAWDNVAFKQYKFNHAVAAKQENARWHIGVIAQDIKAAFEAEGLDAFSYGLLCFDEWEDELDDQGNLLNPAGSSYGVRYEELLALDAAYIRNKLSQL